MEGERMSKCTHESTYDEHSVNDIDEYVFVDLRREKICVDCNRVLEEENVTYHKIGTDTFDELLDEADNKELQRMLEAVTKEMAKARRQQQ